MTRLSVSIATITRRIGIAAVVVAAMAVASSRLTAQGTYTFTVIEPEGNLPSFPPSIAINNSGAVAFVGTPPLAYGVYRGDGGSLTQLYAPGPGEPPPSGYLAINAAGIVAFSVGGGLPWGPQILLSDGSAATHVNGPWSPSGSLTINDAAEFVYAIQSGTDSGVGLGAAITPLAVPGDPAPGGILTGAYWSRVNNLGQVVFYGVLSNSTGRFFRTSTTPGGPIIDMGSAPGGSVLFGLNDLGQIAQFGYPPGGPGSGPAAIFVSDGVTETPVVTATPTFGLEPHMTPINDLGHVAFVAQVGAAFQRRIYVWNGNGLWDVVGQGDTIPSLGTVLDLWIGNDSLNDRDQLAISVRYDDGSSIDKYAVVRADPVDVPPVAVDAPLSTDEDTIAAGVLNGSDLHGDPLTFTIVGNGSLGTAAVTNASTGAFTYTPNPDAFGADTFTFKASDGGFDSNVATVTVTIAPINDAPVATDSSLLVVTGQAVSGVLQASDVDGPPLTFSLVANGGLGNAVLTNAATGAFTYTPPAPSSGGGIILPLVSLADTVTFKASDGSLDSNVATVTLVLRVADPPYVGDVQVSTREGRAVVGWLQARNLPAAPSFELVSTPALGAVRLGEATGRFVYRPRPGAHGVDRFSVRVRAGDVTSNVAEVTVVIAPRLAPRR